MPAHREVRTFDAVVINHRNGVLYLEVDLGFQTWKAVELVWTQYRLKPRDLVRVAVGMYKHNRFNREYVIEGVLHVQADHPTH